jgi:hypothetical protein
MGAFENPDLRAPATRIVCLNRFASSISLRKKTGLYQAERDLAHKPRVLVSTPVPMKLLVKQLAIPPRNRKTVARWLVISNQKMKADCRPVVSDYSRPMFLYGASRQAQNF